MYEPITPYEWATLRLEGQTNVKTYNAVPGRTCRLCQKTFVEGERTILFPLPPEDPEEIEKRKAGKNYFAEGVEVHFWHFVDLIHDKLPELWHRLAQ